MDNLLLELISKYFLIRTPEVWSVRKARLPVIIGIIKTNKQKNLGKIPPNIVSSLASYLYKLGSSSKAIEDLRKKVAVPKDLWEQEILRLIPEDILGDNDSISPLLEDYFSRVLSPNAYTTRDHDWVEFLTKSQASHPGLTLGLSQKIEISEKTSDLYEEHVRKMANYSSEINNLNIQTIVDGLKNAWDIGASYQKNTSSKRSLNPSISKSDKALESIIRFVENSEQKAFNKWTASLDLALRNQVIKNITLVQQDPLDPIRTKQIKNHHSASGLREIRIFSKKKQYRIVFNAKPFKILSFGLRRDLNKLIARALSLLLNNHIRDC